MTTIAREGRRRARECILLPAIVLALGCGGGHVKEVEAAPHPPARAEADGEKGATEGQGEQATAHPAKGGGGGMPEKEAGKPHPATRWADKVARARAQTEAEARAAADGPFHVVATAGAQQLVRAWAGAVHGESVLASGPVEQMEETLAIATLLSGQADAAFVHRRPSRFELAAADSADGALLPIVLATDALAFVPPRGATTGEWSLGDLRTMLLAEGGDPDGRVQSLAVAADSSTWSSIGHDLTGGRPVLLPILSLADDAAVARIAGKRPGVASLTPVRLLRGRRAVSLSDSGRALAVPTDATSAVGWPLLRPLYVVTCGPVPGKLHAVMEYARSPEGQRLAEEAGWLPAASWSEGT